MTRKVCEAERIMEHYTVCKDDLRSFSIVECGVNQEEVECLLRNWHSYDRPDIYSFCNEKIYGIEHFEYDAHKRNKRGSLQRKEDNLIAKEMKQKAYAALKDKDSCVLRGEIRSKANVDNYKNNFIQAFNDHYSKVHDYKNRLLEVASSKNPPVSIWFMAEDVTMLGTHINCRDNANATLHPAWPLLFPEVEKIFMQSSKIDGIIFADNYYKILTLVKRNKNAIAEFKKNNSQPNSEFLFFNPHVMSIFKKYNRPKR